MTIQKRKTTTKSDLKAALTRLLKQKDFETISVSDIAKEAGINRGTFYLHYIDKFDMVDKLIDEILQNILLLAATKQTIMSGDIEALYPTQTKTNLSRKIKQMVNERLLTPEKPQGRKYVLCFANRVMPSIVKFLAKEGFLPQNI